MLASRSHGDLVTISACSPLNRLEPLLVLLATSKLEGLGQAGVVLARRWSGCLTRQTDHVLNYLLLPLFRFLDQNFVECASHPSLNLRLWLEADELSLWWLRASFRATRILALDRPCLRLSNELVISGVLLATVGH